MSNFLIQWLNDPYCGIHISQTVSTLLWDSHHRRPLRHSLWANWKSLCWLAGDYTWLFGMQGAGTSSEAPKWSHQSVCSPCHNTTCLFCYFCDPGPWACQASVLHWAPPQPHSVPHVIGISCFEEPEFLTFPFWCHMIFIIFSVPWHLISPSLCLFPQTALWQACGAPFTCQALCSCSFVDNSSIPSYLTSSIYRAQSTFWL